MDLEKHKSKFGNQAENYTKYRRPYDTDLYELLFSLIPEGDKKILDVACGTGKSTEQLVRDGTEVFGVDIDPLMIDEARKQAVINNLSISYEVATAEKLPYPDDTFDAVTVGTAFHWFANEVAIAEIKRVLKKGGLLYIFWTLTTKDVPVEDSIPREILIKYNWEKVPQNLRDLDFISNLLKENGINNVATTRLPFSHNDTVEDQVGLMKTASSYEVLSEENKGKFIDELIAVLTKNLGNRTHFTYEEEIQVCYGIR
jgi:ubiquinone/menaquinone biosynthesis C-methylase UbiE